MYSSFIDIKLVVLSNMCVIFIFCIKLVREYFTLDFITTKLYIYSVDIIFLQLVLYLLVVGKTKCMMKTGDCVIKHAGVYTTGMNMVVCSHGMSQTKFLNICLS